MFFRPIRDKIEALRRMVWKVERTPGAAPVDTAELKRLMLRRIAELEAKEAGKPEDPSTDTRRAA